MAAFWKTSFERSSPLHCRESGTALFIILLVVVLYASLSYAVAKTTSGSGGSLKEVELVNSGAIQQTMNGRAAEFQRLLIRGCSPSDIYPYSYTKTQVEATGLGTVPLITNPDCAIHNTVGGDLPRALPTMELKKYFTTTGGLTDQEADVFLALNNEPIYMSNFPGVGTNAADLFFLNIVSYNPVLLMSGIERCNEINKSLGIDFEFTAANHTTSVPTFASNAFTGNLEQSLPTLTLPTAFHGRNAGCVITPARIVFYYQIVYEQ